MPFSCFGKRHAKKPREPPPSIDDLDRPAPSVRVREDLVGNERTDRPSTPPHQRYSVNPCNGPATRVSPVIEKRPNAGNIYQHSQRIPVTQFGDSPVLPHKTPPTGGMPVARQLSSELLSMPVPVGGGNKKMLEDIPTYAPKHRLSSEVYLDPSNNALDSVPLTSPPAAPPAVPPGSKQKASLSDEKKSDILKDYFQSSASPNGSTSNLSKLMNVRVPHHLPGNDQMAHHDYGNIVDYPDPFSPPATTPDKTNFPLSSPRSIPDLHKHSNGSSENSLKSPRRPQPMPRAHNGSGNSSRKQSLTNEMEEQFNYENVTETLHGLADAAKREGSNKTLPVPQPRSRTSTDHGPPFEHGDKSGSMHITVPQSTNFDGMSTLQKRQHLKQGYVDDVNYVHIQTSQVEDDYVPPSTEAPHISPNGSVNDKTFSWSLGNNGYSVNLNTPIPKSERETDAKGYTPMDHSSKTIAHRNGGVPPPIEEREKRCNLNVKVPVGDANALHVPGYVTILSGPEKGSTGSSGMYYNLPPQPAAKGHHQTGSTGESAYFG